MYSSSFFLFSPFFFSFPLFLNFRFILVLENCEGLCAYIKVRFNEKISLKHVITEDEEGFHKIRPVKTLDFSWNENEQNFEIEYKSFGGIIKFILSYIFFVFSVTFNSFS